MEKENKEIISYAEKGKDWVEVNCDTSNYSNHLNEAIEKDYDMVDNASIILIKSNNAKVRNFVILININGYNISKRTLGDYNYFRCDKFLFENYRKKVYNLAREKNVQVYEYDISSKKNILVGQNPISIKHSNLLFTIMQEEDTKLLKIVGYDLSYTQSEKLIK